MAGLGEPAPTRMMCLDAVCFKDHMKSVTTVGFFALWFALNALFNVSNKRALDQLHLPWLMTFVQLSTGFFLILPLWLVGARQKPCLSYRKDWRWILPLGFYHMLSSAGGVHAINSGSVSTFQILKTMEPIITAILAAILLRHFFSWQVYGTIVVVTYGILHAFWDSWDDVQQVTPVILGGTLVSTIGAALRSLYSKQKLENSVTPCNLFAVMNATSTLLLLPFAMWEGVNHHKELCQKASPTVVFYAVTSGFLFYANNEVAFYALRMVHPVTHAVANILRRVIVIFVSVLFLNDELTVQKVTGAAIATFGVFLYSIAKYKDGDKSSTTTQHTLASIKQQSFPSSNQRNQRNTTFGVFGTTILLLTAWQFFKTEKLSVYLGNMDEPTDLVKDWLPDLDSSNVPDTYEKEGQQQLVHFLRANDISLNEIVHVFNRTNELSQIFEELLENPPPTQKENDVRVPNVNAKGKVMCAVGISQDRLTLLSHVWVKVLQGIKGKSAPDHSTPATAFETSCDVIISSGGKYQSVSAWAFRSPIPVINLQNEGDRYYPQDALLFAYQQFVAQKKLSGKAFSTDMLLNEKVYFNSSSFINRKEYARMPINIIPQETIDMYNLNDLVDANGFVYINDNLPRHVFGNWVGPLELMAPAEMAYLFQFELLPCPKEAGEVCSPKLLVQQSTTPDLTTHAASSLALLAAMAELALAKSGSLPDSYQFPGVRCTDSFGAIVSGKVHGHDPHLVYAKGGNILFALEWERVTGTKYGIDSFSNPANVDHAAQVGAAHAESNFNVSASEVKLIVITRSQEVRANSSSRCEVGGDSTGPGEKAMLKHFPGVPIIYRDHLFAHATHGFFDSPFETALVLALHGGGSEPYSGGIYLARRGMQVVLLKTIENHFMNIGHMYMFASSTFPEVVSRKPPSFADVLAWAGTFMGYTALGKEIPCMDRIEKMLIHDPRRIELWDPLLLIERHCADWWNTTNSTDPSIVTDFPNFLPLVHKTTFPSSLPFDVQRDIAFTIQELFERSILHMINQVKHHLEMVDGIVLAGGCALNVKVTQRVWDTLDKPVWVASAPSDNGLGVGGIWSVCQPSHNITAPLQYHGLPLLDKQDLPATAKKWGESCEHLGMNENAATRLAKLIAVEKRIVAVVVGKQEYGPRALSHRSLMAYPDSIEIRERMNALKFRQFYRPTCPTVAEEFVEEMFVQPAKVHSPFMSFAPKLKNWVKHELPAVQHFDGTARPQTLSKWQEPFVHLMVTSIPNVLKDGKPVVINTSFNIKGQPIINTLKDTLSMLCDRPQLDYAFVDGYLFHLESNATHPECELISGGKSI